MVKKEAIQAILQDLPAEVELADVLERLAVLNLIELPASVGPGAELPMSWREILEAVSMIYRMRLGLEPTVSLSTLIDEIEADQAKQRRGDVA